MMCESGAKEVAIELDLGTTVGVGGWRGAAAEVVAGPEAARCWYWGGVGVGGGADNEVGAGTCDDV